MYSLFSPEVLACGAISGGAYVVILLIRAFANEMLAGLRWLWNGVKEFLLAVSPLLTLILICWLIRDRSWAETAYKWMGCTSAVVMAIAYVIVYGANRGRK